MHIFTKDIGYELNMIVLLDLDNHFSIKPYVLDK